MSLCLATALKAGKVITTAFTLIWTHSVEKTRWEENWRVDAAGLTLVSARVKGTGAGMEPPPHARRENGWYVWSAVGTQLQRLVLARSGAVEDWRLCTAYECLPVGLLVGNDPGAVELSYCP